MTDPVLFAAVTALLAQEGRHLDTRNWKAWISLFTEDVVYWVPAWASELELTSDPSNELSMVYIRGRGELEDRLFRIASGDSFASLPLDRTVHIVGSVMAKEAGPDEVHASAPWIARSFGNRGPRTLGGHYEYVLRKTGEGLRIAHKRIELIDDGIEGPIDIYHL